MSPTRSKNYHILRRELQLYRPELVTRPEILVLSKSELTGSAEVRARFRDELGLEPLSVSAVTGQGLNELIRRVVEQLNELRGPVPTPPPLIPPHKREPVS
jgi:GTP-binding protein